MGLEAAIPVDSILSTRLNRVINWARRSSLWPMPFNTACCGIEVMSTLASRFDLARFANHADGPPAAMRVEGVVAGPTIHASSCWRQRGSRHESLVEVSDT